MCPSQQEVFTLSRDATYEGTWGGLAKLRARAGVTAYAGAHAALDPCHGINVGLEARAEGRASGALSVFVAAQGDAQAFAAAGAQLRATLSKDPFGRFGLSADVGAYAEAAVAGALSIGLDGQQVMALAEDALPNDLAVELFRAFLDELELRAGVWGRASFSAMARAYLSVYASLVDDHNAGFVFEVGGAAGLKAGAGWDLFAVAHVRDPRRYYDRAVELITSAVVMAARERLRADLHPTVEVLELLLPIALHTAYDVGQAAAEGVALSPDAVLRRFVDATLDGLQRYLLSKVGELADRLLGQLVDEVVDFVARRQLPAAKRALLRTRAEALLARLQTPLAIDDIAELATDLIDLAVALDEPTPRWRQPIALAWTTLAIFDAVGPSIASRYEAEPNLRQRGGAALSLPNPPQIVRDEYAVFLGASVPALRLAHAIDYLLAYGQPLIEDFIPETTDVLRDLETTLGVGSGDLLEAALLGALGESIATTQLFGVLRDRLRLWISDKLEGDLLPQLRKRLGANANVRLYMDEVVEPSLRTIDAVLFSQLDSFASSPASNDALTTLRLAMGSLVYRLFARNVVVLGDIVISHTLMQLSGALDDAAQSVRLSNDPPMLESARTMVVAALPEAAALIDARTESLKELLAELLEAGAAGFGPDVWTQERRKKLRESLMQVLASDGRPPGDAAAHLALFAALADCDTVPQPEAIQAIAEILADVTLDELRIVVSRVIPALARFSFAATADVVELMDRAARQFIKDAVHAVEEALRILREWEQEVRRLAGIVQQAAAAAAAALASVAAHLNSPARRREILAMLESVGRQAVIDGIAAVTPNWHALSAQERAALIALPLALFQLAFDGARPALDLALQAAALPTSTVATLMDSAADALVALDVLSTSVTYAIKDALRGVGLPTELSGDQVVAIAESMLLTDDLAQLLRQAFAARTEEQQARGDETAARAQESASRTRYQHATQHVEQTTIGPDAVEVLSPAAMPPSLEDAFVYGSRVPLYVRLPGATPGFLDFGSVGRVLLALNGTSLPIRPEDWAFDEETRVLSLRTELPRQGVPLRSGFNVLECSVADGVRDPVRQIVPFMVDPRAPSSADLVVLDDLSRFDTPGNDHRELADEQLTIANRGSASLDLSGWRLMDRKRHTLEFAGLVLEPGDRVTIATGDQAPTGGLAWGQRAAVWNNRGDAVYIVDANDIVQAEFVY